MDIPLEQFLQQNWGFVLLYLLWVIPWQGAGLWMSARRHQFGWFVAILVINSFAILPIIYILFIGRKIEVEMQETSSDSELEK